MHAPTGMGDVPPNPPTTRRTPPMTQASNGSLEPPVPPVPEFPAVLEPPPTLALVPVPPVPVPPLPDTSPGRGRGAEERLAERPPQAPVRTSAHAKPNRRAPTVMNRRWPRGARTAQQRAVIASPAHRDSLAIVLASVRHVGAFFCAQ